MKFPPLLAILAALCLSFAQAGCGGSGDDASDAGSDSDSDSDSNSDSDSDSDSDGDSDSDSDTDSDSDSDGDCVPDTSISDSFSFFVMSLEKIQEWSQEQYGDTEGLGGNLGGLAGADAKCQEAAEAVGSCKQWHAFLSATDDGSGSPANAIDRIGSGPWYNVDGLLMADDATRLLNTRPDGATDAVYNDGAQNWPFNQCLTTELGNCTLEYGDSHDTLTSTDRNGQLYSNDAAYTCNDWTSTDVAVQLSIGHSWPRQLNSTQPNSADWIYAHTNCEMGGGASCNGCGRNINLSDDNGQEGVGGAGGYGAWYCFAYAD